MSISKSSISDKTLLLQAAAQKIRYLSNCEDGPIQEGHVTSSNNSVLATELFGPILLETLSGFLFVVNEHGKVISVTDNLNQYLGYSPNQWIEQSVYNFLHVGDHAAFSQALLPLTTDKNKLGDKQTNHKSRPLSCWLRCSRDNNNRIETVGNDEKFVPMQISCLPQFLSTDMSDQTALNYGKQLYLVCVAQRHSVPLSPHVQTSHTYPSHTLTLTPTPKTLTSIGTFRSNTYINMSGENNSRHFSAASEFFTTQMNSTGQILNADMSSVRFSLDQSSVDLTGKSILDFVHTNDSSSFQKHIAEVKKGRPGTNYNSSIYRFKLGDSRFAFIQTRSQILNPTQSSEDVVILSKHNIIRECDSSELKGSASSSLMKSIIQSNPPQTQLPSSNSGGLRHLPSHYQRTYNTLSSPQLPHNPYQIQSPSSSSALPHTHRTIPNINQPLPSPHQQFSPRQSPCQSPRQSSMTVLPGVQSSLSGWDFENEGWKAPSSNHISLPNTNQLSNRTRHSSGYSDKSSPIIQYQNITGSSTLNEMKLPSSLSDMRFSMTVRPDSATSQTSSSGKLRDLLISTDNCVDSTSTVSTPVFSPSTPSVSGSTSGSKNNGNNGGDDLIKHLLLEDEDDFSKPLMASPPATSIAASKSEVSSSDAISQSSPNSQNNKTAQDHHLLKKLLTEEKEDEPLENCKLLQKLLKADPPTDQSSIKSDSSSPAGSHTSSTSSKGGKKRNTSTSSIKDKSEKRRNSKSREKEDFKEINSVGSVKRKAVTTEADSSSHTALINQLLSDRQQQSTLSGVGSNVTGLPSERVRKQPKVSIIDVIDNKITQDRSEFSMERFTKLDHNRTHTSYLRPMDIDTLPPEKAPLRTSLSIDMEKMTLPQPNFNNAPQTLRNMYNGSNKNNMKPSIGMDFETAQPPKYFPNTSDDAHMMAMIESIISSSDTGDPGGNNQVQTIEDQLAIRDIEQQLLSLEPQNQNHGQRIPSHALPLSPNDPLNYEPAMASNPAHSNAMFLVDHRPPFNRSQPQLGYPLTSTPQPANIRMQAAGMRGNGRGRRGQSMGSRAANSNLGGNTRMRNFTEGSSFNTQGTNSFAGFPPNFGEIMKSSAPPPNIELPMDMPGSSYAPTCSGSSASPLNNRGTNSFASPSPDVSTSGQYPQYLELQTPFSGAPSPHSNQPPPQQRLQQNSASHRYISDSPYGNLSILDPSMSVNLNNNINFQQFQSRDPNTKISPGASSRSEYVKQGLRNVCVARAQQTMPVTSHSQTMMPHMMNQLNQPDEGIEMATKELPDDILEQISALANERDEMQKSVQRSNPNDHPALMSPLMSMAGQEMMSNGPVVSSDNIAMSKITQTKQEAEHVREQLRALAHSTASNSAVDSGSNLFRAQLSGPQSKNTHTSPNDNHKMDVNRLKMTASSQPVNIIQAPDPRPSVAEMQPNDNRNSILQALLTNE